MTRKTLARITAGLALGATVFSSVPSVAVADTASELQAQLDAANAHLDELYSKASEANELVLQAEQNLSETSAEIETKQTELEAAQEVLANRVSSDYKTGGVSLLSIIFNSSSFDDMVSRITYASKASASDAETIQQVKDIQAELDAKKAEQQQLLSEQQSQQAELESSAAEATSYVSSLDSQVQAALAEEQAARAAEQAALAAEAQQQVEANNGNYVEETEDGGTTTVTPSATTTTTNDEDDQPASNNTTTNTGSNSAASEESSSGGFTQSQRNAIVSAAWGKVGCAYVYGASGPDAYDCSGFVQYCYSTIGIYLDHYSYSQGSFGHATSNPQAGDIVYYGGHVGIYVGNGMMIDAGNESTGVIYREVYGSPSYRTL